MSYTPAQLQALKHALACGERRVAFADKSVEYRSIDELRQAIRVVEAELARSEGASTPKRQIRVSTHKGFA